MTKKYYKVLWGNNSISTMSSFKLFDIGESVSKGGFFGLGGVTNTGIVIERFYYKNGEQVSF